MTYDPYKVHRKKGTNKVFPSHRNAVRDMIEDLLKQGFSPPEIHAELGASLSHIRKVRQALRGKK